MTIWLSSGEASGDRWGAGLAAALRRALPDVKLIGLAGPMMREAGVANAANENAATGVMGFAEPVRAFRSLRMTYREAVAALERGHPDAVVVIDYPDFHLRLARRAKALGLPVVYYIAPQVWAWRSHRARKVARLSDRVVTAFEWERSWYMRWMPSEHVVWTGHPLADELGPMSGMCRDGPLALLPGSRRAEIARIAPTMIEAAKSLGGNAVFAMHSEEAADWVREAVGERVPIVVGRTGETLSCASAAVVCAGSATLEAACAGLPFVIVYRTDGFTYWLARRLVRSKWCGLPNIILQRNAYPELVQGRLTPETLAEAIRTLRLRSRRRWTLQGQAVRNSLGGPGVADRVAQVVLQVAERNRTE